MTLDDLSGRRVYLDSNILIYAVEAGSRWTPVLRRLFMAIDTGAVSAVTSELTLAEILVRPLQLGAGDLVGTYEALLAPGRRLRTVPIDRAVLKAAAGLQGGRQLKLADAIHAATAEEQRCDAFISNDERLGRKLPPGIGWVALDRIGGEP